jgi:aspartyl-tRNA(Asn)/glutamyl-tRNA(Gln) amidotransferase subunit C
MVKEPDMNQSDSPPIIDINVVSRVARLARLAPDAAEKAALQQELSQILGHFQRLEQLDTRDVLPSYHPQQLENQLRPDEVYPSASRDELLALAERQKEGCLMVPRTVE